MALQTVVVNTFLGGFGPAQSLLSKDQDTSLAIAGLHGTAMGVASVIAGAMMPFLAHRFGRANSGWIGILVFTAGLAMMIAGISDVRLTITAALIAGIGVSIVMNTFVTALNGHFGDKAPLAVSQGNGISSVGYVTGTAVVGSIAVFAPAYWPLGLLIPVPLILFLFFVMREKSDGPREVSTEKKQSGKLSLRFWFAWAGFVGSIGTEFSTLFWASKLIEERGLAKAAIATVAVMCFGTGMGIGRWFGGRVLHRFALDAQVMIILALQLLGFLIFWSSQHLIVSLIALFMTGTGVSMQFALQSLRLISLSDNRPDLAIGRSGMGVGISIGGFPFFLGVLGDEFGITKAYALVPITIVIIMVLVKLSPTHVPQKTLDDLEI